MERASWRRKPIALYLDVVIFGVFTYIFGVILFEFPKRFNDLAPLALAAFSFFVANQFRLDPGRFIMSITPEGEVSTRVREQGNWLVILLGVLFVLDGSKSLIRWRQLGSKLPYFGLEPDPAYSWIIAGVWGAMFITAGICLLKVEMKGFYLGLIAVAAGAISAALSNEKWDDLVAQTVVNRRSMQGLPGREGEIEFMQMIFPEVMLGIAAILVILLFLVRPRLARAAE